ncbi:hypothetical protein GW17_00050163 [Ensete ventricosum]|nr:hypothetical protein GW17_00050163 [Ensete ventricosum]
MDHEAEAHRTDLMTITRYVLNEQSRHPESRGDFSILLSHIVLGCKFVCSSVNKVRSFPLLFFDHLLIRFFVLISFTPLDLSNLAALPVSGKKEAISRSHKSVLLELKGFGYFMHTSLLYLFHIGTQLDSKWPDYKDDVTLDEVLQPGKNMLAAGYCMYGSSCTLVLSTGSGVNGFTLDPSLGEFILTHPDIKALDLVPTKIHQRSPIFLGSYDEVEEIKALYAAEENTA